MKNPVKTVFSLTNPKIKEVESNRDEYEPADFETAITATGFGRFNWYLLLVSVAGNYSSSFATTTMSYILPAAQCDLQLSLVDKGILNACTYIGMITSSFFWGFLADTQGRKKLLVWGFFIDTLCNIGCALSQTFWMLLTFKYLSGFIVTGPYAVLMSYLSEFHSTQYRARVILLSGVFLSMGNVALPLLAWWIIPQNISFNLFTESIHLNSWQVFLAISAIPSLLASIGHMTLPESPKFLMTTGRTQEALDILKKVYAKNTKCSADTYSIKVLEVENPEKEPTKDELSKEEKKGSLSTICDGLTQLKPLVFPPHLKNVLLVCALQFGGAMGMNTLRLWLPQLFTTINEYRQQHNNTADATLCEMITTSSSFSTNATVETVVTEECVVATIDDEVYINSIIIAGWSVIGYFFVGTLINAMGKKNLLIITFMVSGLTGIANYWSKSSLTTLAFSSTFLTLAGICNTAVISVTVELFPTTLRTMTISMSLMLGRIGAIIGNLVFPFLLGVGCFPPFLLVGGTTLVCALISLMLPSKTVDFK